MSSRLLTGNQFTSCHVEIFRLSDEKVVNMGKFEKKIDFYQKKMFQRVFELWISAPRRLFVLVVVDDHQ